MSGETKQWVRACAASDIRTGEPKGVTLGGIPVALYRLEDGVYATHDVCTHAYALLSEGYIEGDIVECPLHGALFEIRSGKCRAVGTSDLAIYPVRVEANNDVMVEISLSDGAVA